MWIRSQDKDSLVKVNTLKICYLNNQGYGIFSNNHLPPNERMALGYYSTKEKALDVLDLIENYQMHLYAGTSGYRGKPFQMPPR